MFPKVLEDGEASQTLQNSPQDLCRPRLSVVSDIWHALNTPRQCLTEGIRATSLDPLGYSGVTNCPCRGQPLSTWEQ